MCVMRVECDVCVWCVFKCVCLLVCVCVFECVYECLSVYMSVWARRAWVHDVCLSGWCVTNLSGGNVCHHTHTSHTHTHSNTSKHAHIHSCICNSVGLEKLWQGAYVHWSDLNAVLLLQLWWERVVISRELWKRKYCKFQTHSLFHFIVHHLILCRNGRGGRALGGWGKWGDRGRGRTFRLGGGRRGTGGRWGILWRKRLLGCQCDVIVDIVHLFLLLLTTG